MKKFVFILILIIIQSSIAQARVFHCYGIKTGISVADQEYDYAAGFTIDTIERIGWDVRGFVEWFDPYPVNLVCEVRYFQKGMKLEVIETNEIGVIVGEKVYDNSVDYITTNILLKFKPIEKAPPYFYLGPKCEFLIGYSGLFSDIYKDFKTFEFGGVLGGGIDFRFGRIPVLFLEFVYNLNDNKSYHTEFLTVTNKYYETAFHKTLKAINNNMMEVGKKFHFLT